MTDATMPEPYEADTQAYVGDEYDQYDKREQIAESGGGTEGYQQGWERQERGLDRAALGQGKELQQGADLRPMADVPDAHYQGYSHEALKQMVEVRNNPAQVTELGEIWNDLGNAFVEFRRALDRAVTRAGEHWHGQAANMAMDFTSTLSQWFNNAAQGAQLAGNRVAILGEMAEDARNKMPEPVDFDPTNAVQEARATTDPITFHNALAAMQERHALKQAAHAEAVRIVQGFDNAIVTHAATMPSFAPPPTMTNPDTAVDSGHNVIPDGDSGEGDVTQFTGDGSADHRVGGPSVPPEQPSGPGSPGGPGTPVVPRTPDSPVGPLAGDDTTQQSFAPSSTAVTGASPVGQLGGGTASGGGLGMGYTVGGPGFPGSPNPPGGPSQRPGAPLTGGLASTARTSTPAIRGTGGTGGVGGVPVRGKRTDDEDLEHSRPDYLVEPDANAIFGTDERTVRPVIGDT